MLDASAIAVRRGQKRVDPAILPLVCLEIGTVDAAIAIDSIVLVNLDTRAEKTMTLANSVGTLHPDMLTAAAPDSVSLSLPILRLKPGRYEIKSVELVGGGLSTFTCSLDDRGTYWFEVKPGCVNYVGAIHLSADWLGFRRAMGGAYTDNQPKRATGTIEIVVRDTVRRDVRWACDAVPGMAALPMAVSPVQYTAHF